MQLARLVELVGRVRSTTKKTEKVTLLAAFLQQTRGKETELAAFYPAGTLPQGKIGVGWRMIEAALTNAPPAGEPLALAELEEAARFLERALDAGHEGVMAKSLESPYRPGQRGSHWLKLKATTTLDLVVLAAEWGHGRRAGWLSNLHLGARDPASGQFVMLGKTFKGLTDETLAWQTQNLLALEVNRDTFTVYVRPQLVVEVTFGGIQESPRYPGGLALRFARVKRYRPEKPAAEADTIQTVMDLLHKQRE
jgi:ATP-dependent DNA ligase